MSDMNSKNTNLTATPESSASYAYTKAITNKYGITAKKSLGQNFLTDNHVLQKILRSAEICKDDTVIEIGPGIGTMTHELCRLAKRVVAVEIDKSLIPVLTETLSKYDNLTVINNDILKTDINEIIGDDKSVKLVANLPYYITTPIIMRILENEYNIKSICVMVQKEVGERMRAKPSTKDYGSLTVSVAYFADAELLANVPPNCFFPRPNVDSCVIKLNVLEKPRVNVKDREKFFTFVKAAFSKRRKTLVNCLTSYEGLSLEKNDVLAALNKLGLSESVRGEALDITEFSKIAEVLL